MKDLKSIKREEIVENEEYMVVVFVLKWEAYKEAYVMRGKGNEVLDLLDWKYTEDDIIEVYKI